mmetsp:Transcript_47230/g.112365  ORF Transcript_47230/g.112365 Transcript_47230/m.112365 type:complete len:122 (+) Transcript_47230:51-416(+)
MTTLAGTRCMMQARAARSTSKAGLQPPDRRTAIIEALLPVRNSSSSPDSTLHPRNRCSLMHAIHVGDEASPPHHPSEGQCSGLKNLHATLCHQASEAHPSSPSRGQCRQWLLTSVESRPPR